MGIVEYKELPWGDLIYGTQSALQAIGVGATKTFPGQPGGPKRKLKTTDPRGFACEVFVADHMGDDIYGVSIPFPGRESPKIEGDWIRFSNGVMRRPVIWFDEFKGAADDLVAAGLVPPGCFPGMPGMNKVMVTIYDGGKRVGRSKGGLKTVIRRSGKGSYSVMVDVPRELGQDRLDASNLADKQWEIKMSALPRPPRIDQSLRQRNDEDARVRRGKLRLVWSKPRFVPGFNSLPPGPFAT